MPGRMLHQSGCRFYASSVVSSQTPGPEPGESTGELTLAEAADQLGVHYMTAYRHVRLGQLKATKVGGEWRIRPEALEEYSTSGEVIKTPLTERELDDIRAKLHSAAVAGDEAAAWEIAEPVLLRAPDATILYTSILGPVLSDIGEAWAAGELSIAAEHRATVVARQLMGRARPWFRGPGRRRGLVAVGAPESDHHSLPTAMFADLIRAQGPDAIDLGAQTPASTFADVAGDTSGGLVIAIVVTHPEALDDAAQCVEAIRGVDAKVPVLVGGYAVATHEHADALGATHWAKTSHQAASLATAILHDGQ